jgi:hypothetical protein
MRYKLLPVILVLLFGFFATSIFAASERSFAVRKNPGATGTFIATASATPVVRGKSNLAGEKLRACQTKEISVQKRLSQLTRLVISMEGKFDAIALRVKNFYSTKVLAAGKSLSNYAELIAEIDAKKVLVDTALTKTQTDLTGFSCTEGDPKGLLNKYRLNMQAVKKALGDYRTSIKNLIVAVHTLVGDTESPEPGETTEGTSTPVATATPTPTVTPTPTATATPEATPTATP